jgi:hypothetical protein
VACTELGGLLLLASRAAPALQPVTLLRLVWPAAAAASGFVVAAGLTAAWLRGSAAAYVAFAGIGLVYMWAFWKHVADATDRRTAADAWNWLAVARGSRRLSPADPGKAV